MQRDIMQFVNELTDYINNHIAGSGHTKITGCIRDGKLVKRGHIIPVKIACPAGSLPKDEELGMAFYAEELLTEMPDASVAAIGEAVNRKVEENYENMLSIAKIRSTPELQTLDGCDPADIILTAVPEGRYPGTKHPDFCIKELPDRHLTLTLKACFPDGHDSAGNSYFFPVKKPERRSLTQADWDNAEKNCLQNAKIRIQDLPMEELKALRKDSRFPVLFYESSQFYDYFYLASPKTVFENYAVRHAAKSLLAFPMDAYTAAVIPITEPVPGKVLPEKGGVLSLDIMALSAIWKQADPGIPPLLLNCSTWEFTEYKPA